MAALPALPTGTVTFLFTDIEVSTRLLAAHPTIYRDAVRRHHDLLLGAVEAHGGAVFETVGDAVCGAGGAGAAVAGTLAGQRAVAAERWPEGRRRGCGRPSQGRLVSRGCGRRAVPCQPW
jgi:class 3 adenylate cyclase